MQKKIITLGMTTVLALLMLNLAVADSVDKDKPKRITKGNMSIKYNILPKKVDSLSKIFSGGIFYGRLRSNSFYWDWENETWNDETKKGQLDNKNMGMGGSIIYKTGVFNGLSATMSYYGSVNPSFFRMDKDEVAGSKAGKDTFSRYNVKNDNQYGIYAFGENYLQYQNNMFNVILGRQFFESVFTASNDTKMIPNTFDGIAVNAKIAKKTQVRFAFFDNQKLRDHDETHDVITFKDSNGDSWGNNDDAATHKGLTYEKFVNAGEDVDHDLIIADFQTKYIDNLKLNFSFLQVPGVVKDVVLEANYKVGFDNGWAIRPGVRYFYQMDDGGGVVAGYTSLNGKEAVGYDGDIQTSLDSSLVALRTDLIMPNKKGFLRLGYSKVEDKADIIAPWRGFPTGGYTRAMAQYNWYANTETIMLRGVYNFNPNFKASLRYAVQDFDNNKLNISPDSTIWHLDTWYDISPQLQLKTRLGIYSADTKDTAKFDNSYNEYRLELNYLF